MYSLQHNYCKSLFQQIEFVPNCLQQLDKQLYEVRYGEGGEDLHLPG